MSYIVVDFEWNQYPKWMPLPISQKGEVMKHEIIQIGAVKVDDAFRYLDGLTLLVCLPCGRKLSKRVATVIGRTQAEINEGVSFPKAYDQFVEWCGETNGVLSWGPDDKRVLLQNVAFYGRKMPNAPWYDAQKIYYRQRENCAKQAALADAAKVFEIEPEQAHDALSDAKVTAEICQHLDMAKAISEYEKEAAPPKTAPVRLLNPCYSRQTALFGQRAEAREAADYLALSCPKCGKPLRLTSRKSVSVMEWMDLLACASHGTYLAEFKLQKRSSLAHSCQYSLFCGNEAAMEKFALAGERTKRRRHSQRRRRGTRKIG